MNAVLERVQHMGINRGSVCITITVEEVIEAICQTVDITNMTDNELSEAISLSSRAVMGIHLTSIVEAALMNLSYGGSQERLAKSGGYPCEGCPDCYLDEGSSCRNEERCKAWGIYSNQY
jgi:hypothetical protein